MAKKIFTKGNIVRITQGVDLLVEALESRRSSFNALDKKTKKFWAETKETFIQAKRVVDKYDELSQ